MHHKRPMPVYRGSRFTACGTRPSETQTRKPLRVDGYTDHDGTGQRWHIRASNGGELDYMT